ncbi:MAG: DUF2851 family protein [Hymenobacteraceae bacterium]|nr:DUF2851 family protein [Hymenobacteraceae bacterium]
MKEDFLYYLWSQLAFDRAELCTTADEPLQILATGIRNADAGPDFAAARIRIGAVEWSGSVEMHLRASDWNRHQHQHDPAYDQVILQVVWEADAEVRRQDGTLIPTLALRGRVAGGLIMRYHSLVQADAVIPCAGLVQTVPGVIRTMMRERALLERAEAKADRVAALLAATGTDWEATTWLALLAGFGFKINDDPMRRLGQALPWTVVRRYRTQPAELEALLLGQAGLIPLPASDEDRYTTALRRTWQHLQHKHQLADGALRLHDWKFGRMRPANFPPVRLAQVAAVLARHEHLLAGVRGAAGSPRQLAEFFAAPVSAYWQAHYHFGKPARMPARLGAASTHRLVMNVAVPVLVAYARYHHRPGDVEEALALLDRLPAEHNRVLAPYEALDFQNRSAADSQGLMGLWAGYCAPRACLRCAIGANILKRAPTR